MANNIDWGQGVNNNDIGWGQGAAKNNIGWGSIYSKSWAGETDILGIIVKSIFDFITRVTFDLGIYQNEICQKTILENLNDNGLLEKASLLVTPNAYKANKLYSIIPNTSVGDFSVVRATNGSFVNSLGVIEDALPNVPRFDFDNVACPAILVEAQKTNLIAQSNNADGGSQTTYVYNTINAPNGLMEADYIKDTIMLNEHYSEKSVSVIGATQYTYSFFAKADGSGKEVYMRTALRGTFGIRVNLTTGAIIVISGPPVAYGAIYYPAYGYWRIWMTILTTSSGAGVFRPQIMNSTGASVYAGNGTGYYIWGQQVELGGLTSIIPTAGVLLTRNADVITVNPPIGTQKITTTFENNTTQVVTTIPTTFTMPNGRINNVLMQHTL